MNPLRPAGIISALTLLTMLTVTTGCDPVENGSCKNKGEFYTHVQDGKRVSLRCDPSGIDSNGKQQYRWRKA